MHIEEGVRKRKGEGERVEESKRILDYVNADVLLSLVEKSRKFRRCCLDRSARAFSDRESTLFPLNFPSFYVAACLFILRLCQEVFLSLAELGAE